MVMFAREREGSGRLVVKGEILGVGVMAAGSQFHLDFARALMDVSGQFLEVLQIHLEVLVLAGALSVLRLGVVELRVSRAVLRGWRWLLHRLMAQEVRLM
jgi:hypothetical protein